MKADSASLLLYAVTDRAWLGERTLSACVKESIQAGVTFVQLREKELSFEAFLHEAREIKQITDCYRIPFVINDNVDVAIACDADGVHVGQSDMAADDVRARIGEGKILGVSVLTVEQATLAQERGADYLGVGTVFPTATKRDADVVTLATLAEICAAVAIPVVAIGGVGRGNILQLKGTGIDGVAVVSAIFAQQDIAAATRELRGLAQEIVEQNRR